MKEEKIGQYHVGPAFFTKSAQDWKFSPCFTMVGGRSLPSECGLLEDIEFL